MNSHYIPQFILKGFCNESNNLIYCDFDNKTTSVRNTRSVFAESDYYPDELEKDLCHKIEHAFANLFHNKLENAKGSIDLTADEMFVLKKFLIVSSIRYKYELTKNDEHLFNSIPEEYQELYRPDTIENLNRILKCSSSDDLFDYIGRVEKAHFFSDDFKYKKEPDANIPLFFEMKEVLYNYLVFVRPAGKEEFIIPDIGRGSYQGNLAFDKIDVALHMMAIPNELFFNLPRMIGPRDYMLYPLSKDLAILSLSVFYKVISDVAKQVGAIDLHQFSSALGFSDNSVLNSSLVKTNGGYHYEIRRINPHDVSHLNCISINQAKHHIACSDLSKIQQSVQFAKEKIDRDISFLQL